jgi:hypothetical protein
MSKYKPKVLLYGNCQFSVVANWLNQFDCIQVLKPQSYDIQTTYPWEQSVFFPASVLTNQAVARASNDADYFIFHEIVNPKFFASKYLYDQFDSKKTCITNFCLNLPAQLNEKSITNSVKTDINELVRRGSIMKSRYGSDHIDMSKWIEDNWNCKFLWANKNLHPTMLYYIELFKQIKNKLFLELNIDPTKNIPKHSHPLLPQNQIVRIQEIFPNIEL